MVDRGRYLMMSSKISTGSWLGGHDFVALKVSLDLQERYMFLTFLQFHCESSLGLPAFSW
jgi:hypothetical protein